MVGGVSAKEFIYGAGGARKLRVIVIVDDDDSLLREARGDKLEAGFDGAIEITIEKGEGDFYRKVFVIEVIEPSLFDNDIPQASAMDFGGDFAFRDGELSCLKVLASARGVFGSFRRETSKGIVDPEPARRNGRWLRGGLVLLEKLAKED